MPVQIIFADGSKRMAHNLDDSRTRWYERKVYEAEQVHAVATQGIVIRDCSLPKDETQALLWKSELVAQITALVQYQTILRSRFDKRLYLQKSTAVNVALYEARAQLKLLGIQIARINSERNSSGSNAKARHEEKMQRIEAANSRDKVYIDFLRGSLWNTLALIEDVTTRQMIEQILKHSFTVGDTPLFAPTPPPADA